MKDQELEVKFYVNDLRKVERRSKELGAQLSQPRTYEHNLRFDTSEDELASGLRVLRLRQDTAARMTYKGPSQLVDGVRLRREIEFTVSDFESAQNLLEALGFRVNMIYEKYRTVYDLEDVHITLDELPYGRFVEIEGPDPEKIRSVSRNLRLDWKKRAPESYIELFHRLRIEKGLPVRYLTFDDFDDLEISSEDMNLRSADE